MREEVYFKLIKHLKNNGAEIVLSIDEHNDGCLVVKGTSEQILDALDEVKNELIAEGW